MKIKILITIVFLFLITPTYGQNGLDSIVVMNLVGGYKPINIELIKDNKQIGSIESHGGKLTCKSLEAGFYSFRLSGHGDTQTSDSILVKEGQLLELNLTIEGPCLYDHPLDYVPICPENHTDNIIPIVYGLLIGTSKQNSEGKKVHIGGCVVSDCDPQFYCEKHKICF